MCRHSHFAEYFAIYNSDDWMWKGESLFGFCNFFLPYAKLCINGNIVRTTSYSTPFQSVKIFSSITKPPLVEIFHKTIAALLFLFTWFYFVLASKMYIIYPATCYFDSYLYLYIKFLKEGKISYKYQNLGFEFSVVNKVVTQMGEYFVSKNSRL